MRQVPHYLIIGNGRISSHFQYYLSSLSLKYSVWHRQQSISKLHQLLEHATHILLLISDQAIEPFIQQHLSACSQALIHFSGSLVLKQAYGAHPLMTFSHKLYEVHQYGLISFIIDHDAPDFGLLLPGLPNPHVRLHTSLKPKYHALCVMSGNFSCLLWQKLFAALEQEFNIPAAAAHLYLSQQTQNLLMHPATALTGPLVRDDQKTIANNIAALTNDPFQAVYESFITCYKKILEGKNEHI